MTTAVDQLKRMSIIRARLLLDFPWFGALSMRLQIRENKGIKTMSTDGTYVDYNPDFSTSLTDKQLTGVLAHEVMHCFTGDTLVVSAKGLTPIKDITIGDKVYADNGTFTTVVATSKRPYKGEAFRIQPAFGLPFTVTPEHPILIARLPKAPPSSLSFPQMIDKQGSDFWKTAEYILAKDINPATDLLLMPVPATTAVQNPPTIMRTRASYEQHTVRLDIQAAYFIGCFLGDGSIRKPQATAKGLYGTGSSERVITITMGTNKPLEELKPIIRTAFHRSASMYKLPDKNASRLFFSSKGLVKYLRQHFYNGTEKTIPEWFLSQSESIQRSLLKGLIDSDGHTKGNHTEFTNTSKSLIGMMSLLLVKLGLLPSLSVERNHDPNGYKPLYKLRWSTDLQLRSKGVVQSDRWLLPIRSMEAIELTANVYNIETEQHTYCLPFVSTHNCAMRHMFRLKHRDPKRFNKACDLAINPLIISSGLELPEGALIDPQYADMSAEQIYARLEEDGDGGGEGEGDEDCPTGDFRKPGKGKPKPEEGDGDKGGQPGGPDDGPPEDGDGDGNTDVTPMSEHDWEIATEQATSVARKGGKLPAGVERTVAANRQPSTDWKAILRRFIEAVTPADYSWQNLNRRFLAEDIYLPGQLKDGAPRMAVGNDTSGSVSNKYQQALADELTSIMHEIRPEGVDVYHCDTKVHAVDKFTPEDDVIKLNAKGGGGTLFQPVFDAIEKSDETYKAIIFFTEDLECADVPKPPDGVPVLWITPVYCTRNAPFGEQVRIELQD